MARRYGEAVSDGIVDAVAGLPPPLADAALPLARRPGKMLRATLVELCGQLGSPNEGRLVELGVLVELMHAASLLHDDVIDMAESRRGVESAYRSVGSEVAILAGVAVFGEVAARAARFHPTVSERVSGVGAELAVGELMDVERGFDFSFGIDDYLALARRKTGVLFGLAAWLGAREAGLTPADCESVHEFGVALGIAFQIVDDVLDLGRSDTGKPAGTDHQLGLFGLPTILALRSAQGDALRESLLVASFDARHLRTVSLLVEQSGADTDALRVARELVDEAASRCHPLRDGAAGRALADFPAQLLDRTS